MDNFKKTIVLISDVNVRYSAKLGEELEAAGLISTIQGTDEEDTLQMIEIYNPDVLIFDPYMVNQTCAAFITEAIRLSAKLKIIVLSFEIHEVLVSQCISSGAVGFLNKANNVGQLVDAVQKISTGAKIVLSNQSV